MSIEPTTLDLASRINALIERYFEGNVAKAARTWRVSQPTVQRLAMGKTKAPRFTTLRPIARYHGTTESWLQDGTGPDPFEGSPLPLVEFRDFETLVDSLNLTPQTRWAVLSLPLTTSTAHSILCKWGLAGPTSPYTELPRRVRQASQDAAYKAAALQYVSWGYLIDGLIRAYGRERLREKLESELWRARLGFHPVALNLLWLEESKPVLDKLEERLVYEAGIHAGVTMIDWPPVPPLGAVPPTSGKPRRGRPRKTRPVHRYDDRE